MQDNHENMQDDHKNTQDDHENMQDDLENMQDDHENMQDMDILDMNVLDETENESGMPTGDPMDDEGNYVRDDDALLEDENDFTEFRSGQESQGPEVRWYDCQLNLQRLLIRTTLILILIYQFGQVDMFERDGDLVNEVRRMRSATVVLQLCG